MHRGSLLRLAKGRHAHDEPSSTQPHVLHGMRPHPPVPSGGGSMVSVAEWWGMHAFLV